MKLGPKPQDMGGGMGMLDTKTLQNVKAAPEFT